MKTTKYDEVKQQAGEISYPCLMRNIDPDYPNAEVIVLAVSEHRGIAVVNTHAPELVWKIDEEWISFKDSTEWELYEGNVTISN